MHLLVDLAFFEKVIEIARKNNIWVVQYPEEKRDDRPVLEGGQERSTFRGVHRLNKDEDGRVRCVVGQVLPGRMIGAGRVIERFEERFQGP